MGNYAFGGRQNEILKSFSFCVIVGMFRLHILKSTLMLLYETVCDKI
jgi:hypothetical protein